MKLNLDSVLNEKDAWAAAGVALPKFDIAAMREATAKNPEWVHFGAGNIFRGFIGSLSQRLLNEGLSKTGIIACDTFDYEVIDKIYDAHDNLTLNVLLNPDGTTTREVLAGVAQGLKVNFADEKSAAQLKAIFRAPSLKMLSFTITEKGYQLRRTDGSLMPVVEADMKEGPDKARHAMAITMRAGVMRPGANAPISNTYASERAAVSVVPSSVTVMACVMLRMHDTLLARSPEECCLKKPVGSVSNRANVAASVVVSILVAMSATVARYASSVLSSITVFTRFSLSALWL